MKILHTADLHIQAYQDVRWEALVRILDLASEKAVDVLAICGDLFEDNAVAQKLRPKLRELFADRDYRTLIIAGNHDADAYPDGSFLGDSVEIIQDLLNPVEIGEYHFWGFPYEDLHEEEILEYLHLAADQCDPNKPHILLFHGELLDIVDSFRISGETGRQRYLPVKLGYFAQLPWKYVLAGHFHSKFDVHEFRSECYFIYPGSPVAITRREIGVRQLNFLEPPNLPEALELPTFQYEKMEIQLDPFSNLDPIPLLSERLKTLPSNAQLLLKIDGFYNGRALEMSEKELQRALNKVAGKKAEIIRMEFRDIREIVEDDLFKTFLERLERHKVDDSTKEDILKLTLSAIMGHGYDY